MIPVHLPQIDLDEVARVDLLKFLDGKGGGWESRDPIRRLNYRDRLHEVNLPTLIIVGEEDPGTPVAAAQAIHEKIRGSRMVIIPSARHLSNVEQPKVFNESLVEFLKALC